MNMTYEQPYSISETHVALNITIFNKTIETFLTNSAEEVDHWIAHILQTYQHELNTLIIGLGIERLPYLFTKTQNPVSILKLCVGTHCLLFRLLHAQYIPQSLFDFLNYPNFTFVGVGVKEDAKKLLKDYSLRVSNTINIGRLAARKLGVEELNYAGLKFLAREVLGEVIDKPKHVIASRWDDYRLSVDQTLYACVDAFVSREIGKQLIDTFDETLFEMFKIEESILELELEKGVDVLGNK